MPQTKTKLRGISEAEAKRILDRVVKDITEVAKLVRVARANILRELQTDAVAAEEVEHMADGLVLWLEDMAEERE